MYSENTVVACIPYFRGSDYIGRSVTSLLHQTHRDILVIVVNDGDRETPPWPILSAITDPRLIRFDLRTSHGGPFYANSVVLQATHANYFLVQEQDDWSEPQRVAELLDSLRTHKAQIATSGHYFHAEDHTGWQSSMGLRWHNPVNTPCQVCTDTLACKRCFVDDRLTDTMKLRAPHTSLFRTDILRSVGGYYCGFNLHYDTLIMNLVMTVGKLVHTPKPLYNRSMRPDSLTRRVATNQSRAEHAEMQQLYTQALRLYREYLAGHLTSSWLIAGIRQLTNARLSSGRWQELRRDAQTLKKLLSTKQTYETGAHHDLCPLS